MRHMALAGVAAAAAAHPRPSHSPRSLPSAVGQSRRIPPANCRKLKIVLANGLDYEPGYVLRVRWDDGTVWHRTRADEHPVLYIDSLRTWRHASSHYSLAML
jgi:hypothetical protein